MTESQSPIAQGTRAVIQAKYLPLLGEFRAKDREVRYYLRGIYIEPHETDGAYLVATDGHRIVVVHDEHAEVDLPMLVDPGALIIRESKSATLAEFDGVCASLLDEHEALVMRAPARLIDGTFPDWRGVIPQGDLDCAPGAIDPDLMKAISKAPFPGKTRSACVYVQQDKPCVVRFPSLPEVFVLIMPMTVPAVPSRPEWMHKRRRGPAPEQNAFNLVGGTVNVDDPPVADNCRATAADA